MLPSTHFIYFVLVNFNIVLYLRFYTAIVVCDLLSNYTLCKHNSGYIISAVHRLHLTTHSASITLHNSYWFHSRTYAPLSLKLMSSVPKLRAVYGVISVHAQHVIVQITFAR